MLRTVIDAMPEVILVVDLGYRIQYANHAARVLAGQAYVGPGSLTCYQLSHHRDRACEDGDCVCPLREAVAHKSPMTVVHAHRTAEGRQVFMEITAAPVFDAQGTVIQVVEMCRDISERKQIQQLLLVASHHAEMAPLLQEFAIVIVDLALKSGHGLELIKWIRTFDQRIRVLVSSMHDESLFAERSLRAGAAGYINKQESSEKIIPAIRRILAGEIHLSERMASRLVRLMVNCEVPASTPVSALSDRELEVYELIGQGLAVKQIAARLCLSRKTVESHRQNIKTKLRLTGQSELVRHATQWVLENGKQG
jgi:PAS domain S-box-containing protein